MNPKIRLSELIAINCPDEAMQAIHNYGVVPSRNFKGVIMQLDKLIVRYGQSFLNELAMIHPHRDLILSTAKSNTDGKEEPVIVKTEVTPPLVDEKRDYTKYALFGMIGLVAGILIINSRN
jgi:hypothetical protein